MTTLFNKRFNELDGVLKHAVGTTLINPHFVEFIHNELSAVKERQSKLLLPETDDEESNRKYMIQMRNYKEDEAVLQDLLTTAEVCRKFFNK